VGKTNLAVNVAWAWAGQGAQVLLVDGDVGLGNAHILCDRLASRTLEDVVAGRCDLAEATMEVTPGLRVLCSRQAAGAESLGPVERGRLVEAAWAVSSHYDAVVIDTGSGVGQTPLFFASLASEIAVVATPEPTSVADAYAAIKLLSARFGVRRLGLVANRVKSADEGRQLFDLLSSVVGRFLPVVLESYGEIPEDDSVREAVMKRRPVIRSHAGSPASAAIERLAAGLRARQPSEDGLARLQWAPGVGSLQPVEAVVDCLEWA
jgi:flagellar biosynthesis protein FlhG